MRIIEVGTILYKKAYEFDSYCKMNDGVIHSPERCLVTLKVTEPGICADYEENYSQSKFNTKNKCRVRSARVVEIRSLFPDPNNFYMGYRYYRKAVAGYDHRCIYEVNEVIRPKANYPYEEGNWACGAGIHGFESKDDAIKYRI